MSTQAIDQAEKQHWPTITNEQRRRDQQIRLEQAEARRQADDVSKTQGRVWFSSSDQAERTE